MGTCLFLTNLFASASRIYAEHAAEQVLEQGPLHKVLSGYMVEKPHFRMVTAEDPMRFACTWHMLLWSLGEYGRGFSMLTLTPSNCSSKALSLEGAFPCVLVKGASYTTCQGPMPNENVTWMVKDVGSDKPAPWNLPPPEAPRIPYGNPKPFETLLACPNLIGLALARAVRHSGTYRAKTLVLCRRTEDAFRISVDNALVKSSLFVYAKGLAWNHTIKALVNWEAAVDTSGALVLSTERGGNLTRYTRRELSRTLYEIPRGQTLGALDV